MTPSSSTRLPVVAVLLGIARSVPWRRNTVLRLADKRNELTLTKNARSKDRAFFLFATDVLTHSKNFLLTMPFAAVLLVATAVYYPRGSQAGFAFDDYPNILTNRYVQAEHKDFSSLMQTAWAGAAGPLKRPISMVSFALNDYLHGTWPMGYKITNLVVHLVNGWLAFILAGLILVSIKWPAPPERIRTLALVAAAAWLLHPLNLTSVLYVVQRMTSLAALFSFLALICYCAGRLTNDRRAAQWSWIRVSCWHRFVSCSVPCAKKMHCSSCRYSYSWSFVVSACAPLTSGMRKFSKRWCGECIIAATHDSFLFSYCVTHPGYPILSTAGPLL